MTTIESLPPFYAKELEATAQIAAAYLSRNNVPVDDVPALIVNIRGALMHKVEEPTTEPQPLAPAVPIKRSVTPDLIFCLEDGKGFRSLKRHLRVHFNLTPEEYRAKWGLPADYPMVAPNYSATRSQLAKDNGLGRKGSH
jgi:predicted transcriptional regulator